MKNVTGYDLVKLLSGSYGTLGVLTEVSLKVLPMAETEATLVLQGLQPSQAVAAMSAALGSPFEVTGAAQAGADTVLRIEGFAGSVAYRSDALRSLMAPYGTVDILDADASAARWRAIRDVTALRDATDDIWRISVRPSAAPDVIAALPDGSSTQMDWGGGLIWAAVPEGTDVRSAIAGIAGHATVMRGAKDWPTFQPEPAPLAAISKGLRDKFDPRGILNAGVMG